MNTISEFTEKDFNELNFENKLDTIYSFGNFVDSHITSVGESNLLNFYNFNEFQVEVVYDLRGTVVKAINCLKIKTKIEYLESDMILV